MFCFRQQPFYSTVIVWIKFDAWNQVSTAVARRLKQALVESLSNDDGDVNENGKKAKSLDWQNNNFARASRSVCTFLCCHCTYTTWQCLISLSVENMNTRQQLYFSFLEFRYSLLGFNFRKNCQHLTNFNNKMPNKRDKVWRSATSLFTWRFRSRRHRCCLSSLKGHFKKWRRADSNFIALISSRY